MAVPDLDNLLAFDSSLAHMREARAVIPRGVMSAKRDRSPTPLVFEHASGSRLIDIDGNEYVDYLAAFGPALLGHRPEAVVAAVISELSQGVLYGGQHRGELGLAQKLVETVPSAEMVLLCTTGSEAVHAALRIARGATGRELVVKFEGHYHGWLPPVMVNQPGTQPSVGPPPHQVVAPAGSVAPHDVLVCPWLDAEAISELLRRYGSRVAAVILEPIACNAGVLREDASYLAHVRRECDHHGVALIFDEVITGFRLAPGGAQERLGVTPDLTVLGKALGSGFPIAAVVGSADVMSVAADRVAHVGTYNGGSPAVAAANATLASLDPKGYARLERVAFDLATGLQDAANESGLPIRVYRVGSILRMLWGGRHPVRSYADACSCDPTPIAEFAGELLVRGVHISDRGTFYVSMAHDDADIQQTLVAARAAMESLGHDR